MADAQKRDPSGITIEGLPDGLDDSARKDLDETRRLLYMALVVQRTKKYNLAGTLANAIKHHQGIDIDTNELLDHVVDAVEGGDTSWVRGQIDRICEQLGN